MLVLQSGTLHAGIAVRYPPGPSETPDQHQKVVEQGAV